MRQASLCERLFSFSLLQLWFSVPRNPYQYCWLSARSSSEKPHEEFIEHPRMCLHMPSWSLQFCSSLPSYSQASNTFWSALLQYQRPSSFWCLSTFWVSMPLTHMLLLWVLLYRMLPQAWQLCLLRLPISSSFQASSFPGQNRIPLYDPSNRLYYDLPLFSIPWISNAVWYSEFSEAKPGFSHNISKQKKERWMLAGVLLLLSCHCGWKWFESWEVKWKRKDVLRVFLCLLGLGVLGGRTMIPNYWIWLHYLSLFKYPYELCLINEFRNLPHVNWGTVQTPSGSQSISSQDVLDSMSVGHVHVWLNVVVMVGFVVGYRVLFYLALCMIKK